MSVQTSIQSYGSRVGGAFKGIGFGGILVVIGVVALFWNEGRTIKETRKLNEGAKVVVSVAPDSVDASNEGKLIHISGDVVTEGRNGKKNAGRSNKAAIQEKRPPFRFAS